ncbi:hypothetical protein COCC4DRAFT_30717 [Bipolaris maydis ATCC 48331]|uniref:Uncharacterized protein n=2 Tax=Cochliobolus heterostrophus TaxID=5016 RepID=M2UX81_COCH5|nr:uncharacterized protein COCC4DRAFT_30717 [Bipolaris maydis ATCC 48331]EMD92428.1 hypothetical protein COCHEDRAFT_1021218 [Bipolaris maydis C5]ENI08119.1 hypothetical protein COCC4DRAFT_30717 [Bipolaris maydis ATCC 48331]KAJ6210213.1 hypothetical protein PSV09DRAFT_1021218 [Bipolaris maydis]
MSQQESRVGKAWRYDMHVFVKQIMSGVISGTVAIMLMSSKGDSPEFIFRPVYTSYL